MNNRLDLLTIPFTSDGDFTRADLDAWLGELRDYLKSTDTAERGGDAVRVWLSERMASDAKTDREAELVRRGIRLGLHLAAFDRKAYHRAVAKVTLKPPESRVTDADIRIVCDDPKYPTREKQAKKLCISKRYLQERLAKLKG